MVAKDTGNGFHGPQVGGLAPSDSTQYQHHFHILAGAALKCQPIINFCTLDLGNPCLKTYAVSFRVLEATTWCSGIEGK